MRRRPIVFTTEPDMMTAHNSNNTNTNNNSSEQTNTNLTDMEDPELCIEQQSLLYPSESDYDDQSKAKPAKMLSSYRGRRRLVVLAVAVAVTLGVVVVWGPLSSSSMTSSVEDHQQETQGTFHR
jgi:hypothetical protein